jgi:hypothetical protein
MRKKAMRKFVGFLLMAGFGLIHQSTRAIAQPQPPYNCLTREVWSAEKKAWCATHGQAQPVPPAIIQPAPVKPAPVKPSAPSTKQTWHNCLTKEVWTAEKTAWCAQMQQLQNATYQIPDIGTVKLTGGKFSNPAKRISVALVNQPGMVVFADLNRDGRKDAVSLLTVTMSGSGSFTYLSALWNDNGVLKPIDPMFLGDRIQINSLQTKGDRVVVDLLTQSPTDSINKPSQKITKTYAILMQPLLVPMLK